MSYIYIKPYYYNINHILKITDNTIFLTNGETVQVKDNAVNIMKVIKQCEYNYAMGQVLKNIEEHLYTIKYDLKNIKST